MREVARALKRIWLTHHASGPATPLVDRNEQGLHGFEEDEPASVILAGAEPAFVAGKSRLRTLLLPIAVFLAVVVYTAAQTRLGAVARAYLPEPDAIARNVGLGIDQVSLVGHRFTTDGEVFDALDLGNVRSFLRFDAKAAKARVERLPWVATAELTRVYPSRLDIRIAERSAFAIWTRGDRQYLIDATGRTLSPVAGSSLPNLPRVAGEGAASQAKAIFDMLADHPGVAGRVVEAERVGERRWDLKLKDAVTLRLPPEGEAHVLKEIDASAELSRLVTTANTMIDFRVAGRAAVRTLSPSEAAATLAVGGAGS